LNTYTPVDTDEELSTRLANFDEHIAKQKQKQRAEEGRRKDLEDNLVNARQQHVALVNEHGMLVSEANVSRCLTFALARRLDAL
jgi:DNA repair protein RAD50